MKPKLALIVFLSGAAVMVLELVGSRVVAPYLGGSTFVWTSLIGTVLAALSIGYYVGGHYADRGPSYGRLAGILLGSALAVLITAISKDILALLVQRHLHDLRLASVVTAIALFAPCSMLLGMVSPYCIRLAMIDVAHAGSTVGNLYALSTAGSILGTFLGGFWLISFLGTSAILYSVAILLALLAMIAEPRITGISASIMILLAGTLVADNPSPRGGVIADIDTDYQRVWVIESMTGQRTTRQVLTGPDGIQSGLFVDTREPMDGYWSRFVTIVQGLQQKSEILVIGGAGMILPRTLAKLYPDSHIHAVELDPGMTRIAKDHFFLDSFPNLTIEHTDGRLFLNRSPQTFDVIILDAFSGGVNIPFHLITVEALSGLKNMLKPHGIVIQNIVATFTGRSDRALRAIVGTFRAVFPFARTFPVETSASPNSVQNIALISSLESIDDLWGLSHETRLTEENLLPPLTDDFSPLESYLLEVTEQSRASFYSHQKSNLTSLP